MTRTTFGILKFMARTNDMTRTTVGILKFIPKTNAMTRTTVGILKFMTRTCFVALRPKSTAMVIAGRSVHLTTLFPGQA